VDVTQVLGQLLARVDGLPDLLALFVGDLRAAVLAAVAVDRQVVFFLVADDEPDLVLPIFDEFDRRVLLAFDHRRLLADPAVLGGGEQYLLDAVPRLGVLDFVLFVRVVGRLDVGVVVPALFLPVAGPLFGLGRIVFVPVVVGTAGEKGRRRDRAPVSSIACVVTCAE
jgi:hypothetical protein